MSSLHLRAYIAIMCVSFVAFFLMRKMTKDLITTAEFKQWRNAWLFITSAAFLSFNFWIFGFLTAIYGVFTKGKFPIYLYCALLFAIPPISAPIPGFGIINYFTQISYIEIITLTLLMPIFFEIMKSQQYLRFGKHATDYLLVSYIFLNFFLLLRDTTLTDALRGLIHHFLEIYIPYFVISRKMKTSEDFKKLITALFFAFLVAGSLGIFEFLKGWLLFVTLDQSWGIVSGYGNYLFRGASLRASSSFGHALSLSYVASIAIGLYLYLVHFISDGKHKKLGWAILIASIIAPMSRAGWVSVVVIYTVFLLTGKNAFGKLSKFSALGLVALSMVAISPIGDKVINLIPFYGKTETFNVEYRQRLIDVSMIVIAKNPLFGSPTYRDDPDMAQLIQGDQIIDMLNAYLGTTLENGYVGLFFFVGIYVTAAFKLLLALKKTRKEPAEVAVLGRVLLSCIIGTMFTIGSSGFGGILPTLSAMLVGLSLAYCDQLKRSQYNKQ